MARTERANEFMRNSAVHHDCHCDRAVRQVMDDILLGLPFAHHGLARGCHGRCAEDGHLVLWVASVSYIRKQYSDGLS